MIGTHGRVGWPQLSSLPCQMHQNMYMAARKGSIQEVTSHWSYIEYMKHYPISVRHNNSLEPTFDFQPLPNL